LRRIIKGKLLVDLRIAMPLLIGVTKLLEALLFEFYEKAGNY
jgi:hypothetical protein